MSRVQRLLAALIAAALLPVSTAAAQGGGVVTGRIVDESTNRPLVGATVTIVGTALGDISNAQGDFRVENVPAGPRQVRVSVLGYGAETQEVTVAAGATASVNFALSLSAVELDELVVNAVTGQVERRREMGTNVGSIDAAQIENAPITRVADALTARVPGVSVQATQGTTGTTQRIRIRGANSLSLSNEPLVFVDGVQFSNQVYGLGAGGAASSRLNDINPNDIQSFEILKGPAATSQYGTAAANGVILITTKRGQADATRWNVYTEYGMIREPNEWPANYVSYEVLTPNSPVFLDNGWANIGLDEETFDRYTCYNFMAATGVCRQDSTAVFNTLEDGRTTPFQEGFRRKVGASVSGGSANVMYYVSGDIEDEQGVISYNELNRASVRANVTADVTEDLRIVLNSGYIDSDLSINSNDNSVFSPLINGLVGRAFFNPDTTSTIFSQNFRAFSPHQLREFVPKEDVNRLTLGGQATYTPLSWLTLAANSGLDFTNRFYQLTLQPGRDLGVIAPGFYGIGFRDIERTNRYLWTANASAEGYFQLTDLVTSKTTVGGSFQRDLYRTVFAEGAGIVEGTEDVGAATGQFFMDEEFEEIRTVGGFIQQQFGYDDRLFLTLGIRGDDNSAFGADFGFVTYPNANVSWVVNEESWFPQTNAISSLRLRAGYGTSGLRPNFRQAVTLYEPTAVQVGASDVPGVVLDVTGNTVLEPERTSEWEFGADAGFLDNRIAANVTYYNRLSKDALIDIPLEPSFGLTASRIANLGSIRNSGWEFGVDARVLDLRNVGLDLRLASSTLSNEIESLGGQDDIVINRGEQRHREGFPAGAYFQDRYVIEDDGDGLLHSGFTGGGGPVPSEVRIVRDSINGEAIPHYIGPALPTHSNALSGDLRLFDFITISTLFEQRGGHFQLDATSEFRCRTGVAYEDRGCHAVGDPSASLADQAAYIGSARLGTRYGYIHKADFVKWRELSITLGVPSRFQTSGLLRGATLTLSGRNLATWTDYPGMDPEVAEAGTGNFTQNEFNTQPPVRYWTARMNFTF